MRRWLRTLEVRGGHWDELWGPGSKDGVQKRSPLRGVIKSECTFQ